MDLKLRTQLFIDNAVKTHGDKYDYSQINYINSSTKVEIICHKHGSFFQTPNNHTSLKHGCPQCELEAKTTRNTRTTEDFIEWSKQLHGDKYDYSMTCYTRGDKPVEIGCKQHGTFVVGRAEKHHKLGQGCPKCRKGSKGEEIIKNILTTYNIEFVPQKKFDDCISHISGTRLSFDFYLPTYGILIEYDGEQHHKKSPLFHPGDRFERMQQHDIIKNEYAKTHNLVLIRIPHSHLTRIDSVLEVVL